MKQKLNCVLMIDDDEPTNFFNKMMVEESGCTDNVKAVQSGQAALDYLSAVVERREKNPNACPELIFLDINMPAMNGWEFLDKYKNLAKDCRAKIIVVMLTTSLFPEDIQRAHSIPEISGYEHKPLTPEKLDRILNEHFAKS